MEIDAKTLRDIQKIVAYLWDDEERHYEESIDRYPNDGEPRLFEHTFEVLKRIDSVIGKLEG